MEIRKMVIEDYDEVFALWQKSDITTGNSDSRDKIEVFLKYNPETSLVGVIDGEIVANVLGGFDGRRGFVHHLCVMPQYQGRGLGKAILQTLEDEYRKMGVEKVTFWVLEKNRKVQPFYEKLGYLLREDIFSMSKSL